MKDAFQVNSQLVSNVCLDAISAGKVYILSLYLIILVSKVRFLLFNIGTICYIFPLSVLLFCSADGSKSIPCCLRMCASVTPKHGMI
jgi:hypothetical protein